MTAWFSPDGAVQEGVEGRRKVGPSLRKWVTGLRRKANSSATSTARLEPFPEVSSGLVFGHGGVHQAIWEGIQAWATIARVSKARPLRPGTQESLRTASLLTGYI